MSTADRRRPTAGSFTRLPEEVQALLGARVLDDVPDGPIRESVEGYLAMPEDQRGPRSMARAILMDAIRREQANARRPYRPIDAYFDETEAAANAAIRKLADERPEPVSSLGVARPAHDPDPLAVPGMQPRPASETQPGTPSEPDPPVAESARAPLSEPQRPSVFYTPRVSDRLAAPVSEPPPAPASEPERAPASEPPVGSVPPAGPVPSVGAPRVPEPPEESAPGPSWVRSAPGSEPSASLAADRAEPPPNASPLPIEATPPLVNEPPLEGPPPQLEGPPPQLDGPPPQLDGPQPPVDPMALTQRIPVPLEAPEAHEDRPARTGVGTPEVSAGSGGLRFEFVDELATERTEPAPTEPWRQVLGAYELLDARRELLASPPGWQTGFVELDGAGIRFLPGHLYLVHATGGGGKTGVLLELLLRHAYVRASVSGDFWPALFVSAGESRAETYARYLIHVARHYSRNLDAAMPPPSESSVLDWVRGGGAPTPEHAELLEAAASDVDACARAGLIGFVGGGRDGLDVDTLVDWFETARAETVRGPSLVFVDDAHRLGSPSGQRSGSPEQQRLAIVRRLRALADGGAIGGSCAAPVVFSLPTAAAASLPAAERAQAEAVAAEVTAILRVDHGAGGTPTITVEKNSGGPSGWMFPIELYPFWGRSG